MPGEAEKKNDSAGAPLVNERKGIRPYYSGFIIFAAQLLSIITGIIFTLLLTRNMSKPEYGIWANIFDIVGYFLILSGLLPFWVIRFVARGKTGAARTGLLANLVVSLISALIYFALMPTLTSAFNITGQYVIAYFVASAQIVNLHLTAMLESVVRATKPQNVGFGLLIEESVKLALAYVLIVRLQQLFLGALLSIILSSTVQVLYYVSISRPVLKEKVQWKYVREWLKGSTANLYYSIGNQVAAFPIILLFLLGGQAARGDYQAASTFSNIIGYSLFISYALYPRLLAGESVKGVAQSLKTVMMFAIPMTAIVLSIPRSLLTILNVQYSEAVPILILLAIDSLMLIGSQFLTSVIFGVEKLDEEATISMNKLVRSKIFKIFTLPFIQGAISIPACLYALTHYAQNEPVTAAVVVSAINLSLHAATLLAQYRIAHPSIAIKIPWTNIGKYIVASLPTAAMLFVIPTQTTLASTFAVAIAGFAIYAAILLATDRDARQIAVAISNEIRNIFGKT